MSAKRAQRAQVEASLTPQQQLQNSLNDIPTDLDGVAKPLCAVGHVFNAILSDLAVVELTMASAAVSSDASQVRSTP